MSKGKLIILEGVDCSGKSSVLNKLKKALPVIYGQDQQFVFSREPGSLLPEAEEAEEIREGILNGFDLTTEQQAELFAESRLIHTKAIIEYLNKGINVVLDRYLLSSLVYQGNLLGYEKIHDMNKKTEDLLIANDIIYNNIILDINEETYYKRINARQENKDALETVDEKIIEDRIFVFNNLREGKITNGYIYKVNANGEDFARICIDVINKIYQICK